MKRLNTIVSHHTHWSAPQDAPTHSSPTRGAWDAPGRAARAAKHATTACCGCPHSCALQSIEQCAVNFGPILLKPKYVTALAPVFDFAASPPAAELDAPCYPIPILKIGSFYVRSTAGCCRSH